MFIIDFIKGIWALVFRTNTKPTAKTTKIKKSSKPKKAKVKAKTKAKPDTQDEAPEFSGTKRRTARKFPSSTNKVKRKTPRISK